MRLCFVRPVLLQGVAEAECRRAAEAGERAYAAAFSEAVPGDEGALDAEHARCLALAAAAFDDAAVGDAGIRAAHQHKLRDACSARCGQGRLTACMRRVSCLQGAWA